MDLQTVARQALGVAVLVALLTPSATIGQTTLARTSATTSPFVELGGLPGADAGRIVVDPTNSQTAYADVGGGRIARTFSGGLHWEVVQVAGRNTFFRAIAVDPAKPATVVAFTSAPFEGGSTADNGVYVSTDHGGHWARFTSQPVGEQGPAVFGRGVVIDPRGQLIVLADRDQGIFRSPDFGASWTNTLPGSLANTYGLYPDPNDSATIWTAGRDASGLAAAWVSHDRAQTWTRVALPVDPSVLFPLATELAVQPHTGRIIVGINAVAPDFSSLVGAILVSDDGGTSWTQASIVSHHPGPFAAGNTIAFDPISNAIVYASGNGDVGLFRSIDGGRSWDQVIPDDGSGFLTLAVAPSPSGRGTRVFGGGSSSIEISDDGGSTWSLAVAGANALAIASAAADGRVPGGLYATDGLGGLVHSDDGGTRWSVIDPVPGTRLTQSFAVDPVGSNHPIFALNSVLNPGAPFTLWRSEDTGGTWASVTLPVPLVDPFQANLVADPHRAGGLLLFSASAAAFNSLLRTMDSGATWSQGAIGVDGDFPTIPTPIVADPAHPGVVYAAMGSGLWKSTDFGANWVFVPELPLGLYGIAGLAVSGGSVYVVAGADDGTFSLQKSSDGGSTWIGAASAFGPAPYFVYAVGDHLVAYQDFYAGYSDPSVLVSDDGAATWSLLDGNLLSRLPAGVFLSLSETASQLYLSAPGDTFQSFVANLGGPLPAAAWHPRGAGTARTVSPRRLSGFPPAWRADQHLTTPPP